MKHTRLVLLAVVLSGLNVPAGQVIHDGTVGPAGALTGPAYLIPDTAGTTRGNNLFHSFSQFNLDNGDTATFTGPANIHNIITRVTGGASTIDGVIDTTAMPNANFFFINPFGVTFGPHAQVNVSGSFAVTTADYVKLADGGRFDARNPANDILTAAPVSAFGFLGPTAAPIALAGVVEDPNNPPILSYVPDGKSIWLVGGDIVHNGFAFLAFGGEFVMVSVASAGELPVNVDDARAVVDTSSFAKLGNLTLDGGGVLVFGDPGGRAVLEADRIQLLDGAGIIADNYGDNPGSGGVEIRARSSIQLDNASVSAGAFGAGDGGDITFNAPIITINNSTILCNTLGYDPSVAARGGTIYITADDFTMSGGGQIGVTVGNYGTGGNLVLNAGHVRLFDGATIFGSTAGGTAGNISVQADTVELLTGAKIDSDSYLPGSPGGEIHITANTLTMDHAAIISQSIETGSGGGNILLDVNSLQLHNNAGISTSTANSSPAGDITIHGMDVLVDSHAAISSAASADGNAGSVILQLTGSLQLRDGGMLSVSAAQGNGGDVTITAGSSILLQNGQITAQAANDGGNIHLTAPNLIYLLDSQVNATAGHDGGNVTVDPHFIVLNSSQINTSAGNNGGNITLESQFIFISPDLNVSLLHSGASGVDGILTINSPNADLTGAFVPLNSQFLDAASLLRPACSVRLTRGISSFTVAGRSGWPIEPDSLLPAYPSLQTKP